MGYREQEHPTKHQYALKCYPAKIVGGCWIWVTHHRHLFVFILDTPGLHIYIVPELNFIPLMWKGKLRPFSLISTGSFIHASYASFYVCWHFNKSHTKFKRLLWTAQTIRKKNHQIQIIVSPIPALNSLRINLELIHNTYASAQKAWEEKKTSAGMTFTQGQLQQLCQAGFDIVHLATESNKIQ